MKLNLNQFADFLSSRLVDFDFSDVAAIQSKVQALTGSKARWTLILATRLVDSFRNKRTRPNELKRWIRSNSTVQRRFERTPTILIRSNFLANPRFQFSNEAASAWNHLKIESIDSLRQLLKLDSIQDLNRLTLPHQLRSCKFQNYRRQLSKKRNGSGWRLLESPNRRLKSAQRILLREILGKIPVHRSAHGFVRGRSTQSFAQVHCGKMFVLKMDLENFFGSIDKPQVLALFRSLGYPYSIALTLTHICTVAPFSDTELLTQQLSTTDRIGIESLAKRSRLAQGAPSSPSIANLIAYRLDNRLCSLAETCFAEYSRYADDLVFSWRTGKRDMIRQFATQVALIASEEGFRVQHRKTRILAQSFRQQIAGVVVNSHCNSERKEYEMMKSILHDCLKNGPTTANRQNILHFREHLRGRIASIAQLNQVRGAKLLKKFLMIEWE